MPSSLFRLFFFSFIFLSSSSPFSLKDWSYLGPFPVGKSEIDADPLFTSFSLSCPLSSLLSPSPVNGSECPREFPSSLSTGGYVRWRKSLRNGPFEVSEFKGGKERECLEGKISIGNQDIKWNEILQGTQRLSSIEFQSWISSRLHVTKAGIYRFTFSPVHSFFLNFSSLFHGNIYRTGGPHHEDFGVSIFLYEGTHSLNIRVRAKQQVVIDWKIEYLHNLITFSATKQSLSFPLPSPSPHFHLSFPNGNFPDILDGDFPFHRPSFLQFSIRNDHAFWIKSLQPQIHSEFSQISALSSFPKVVLSPLPSSAKFTSFLAPLHFQYVPISFHLEFPSSSSKFSEWITNLHPSKMNSCLTFQVTFHGKLEGPEGFIDIVTNEVMVSLRCRKGNQTFLFNYLDHDGSVVTSGAIQPRIPCQGKGCPLVLTLSGVGVTAQSQIDSFKYKGRVGSKKDSEYQFGFPSAWMLAPNREGAHNWEGTGMATALHIISYIQWATSSESRSAESQLHYPYSCDTSRIVLLGHSRGGKGVLLMGTRIPDRILSIISISGYSDREMYGDANILFEVDNQLAFMDPNEISLFLSTIAENDFSLSASNLARIPLPVLIRSGGSDGTVSPYYQRHILNILRQHSILVNFEEKEGVTHWTWDWDESEDGGMVFDPKIRNWITRAFNSTRKTPKIPFHILCWNPASYHSLGGVSVQQMTRRDQPAHLFVEWEDEKVNSQDSQNSSSPSLRIRTRNVARFSLSLSFTEFYLASENIQNQVSFVVDSHSRFLLPSSSLPIEICRDFSFQKESLGGWHICGQDPKWIEMDQRGRLPINSGPARQVFAHPFVIVVGTSQPTLTPHLLDLAKFISTGHFFASATSAPIVLDRDYILSEPADLSHNLILLGGPIANYVSLKLSLELPDFPVNFRRKETVYELGDCVYSSTPQAIAFTFSFPVSSFSSTHPTFSDSLSPELSVPSHRLNLMIAGTSADILTDLVYFSFSTNVPLTRAPFTNLFPDFLLISRKYRHMGYGGIEAGGFWNSHWQMDQNGNAIDRGSANNCEKRRENDKEVFERKDEEIENFELKVEL